MRRQEPPTLLCYLLLVRLENCYHFHLLSSSCTWVLTLWRKTTQKPLTECWPLPHSRPTLSTGQTERDHSVMISRYREEFLLYSGLRQCQLWGSVHQPGREDGCIPCRDVWSKFWITTVYFTVRLLWRDSVISLKAQSHDKCLQMLQLYSWDMKRINHDIKCI